MEVVRPALLDESRQKLRAGVPKLAIHILVAVLIWIFGQLIFVPLAQTVSITIGDVQYNLAPIVSAIVLIALLIVLVRAAFDLRDTADALAGLAAVSVSKSTTEDIHVQNYQRGFRGVLYVLYAVIIFVFFYAFLSTINPALAGLALVVLVIWAIVVLFQVGGVFSKAVEEWSGRAVERFGSRLTVHESGLRWTPEREGEEPKEEAPGKGRRRGSE